MPGHEKETRMAPKITPVAEIRNHGLKVAQDRFKSLTAVRASLSSEAILEILKPYRSVDWGALGADLRYPTHPGKVSRTVRDTGEKAAQRAWFYGPGVELSGEHLAFVDMEIPVCPGK